MSMHDNRLAAACTGVGDTARKILDWISESGGLMAAERVALLHEVYRTETSASTLARAMRESPCVAFVGPSRSGKTQLISSIIERDGGTLAIRFDGIREHVNFLKHISPEGGRTGSSTVMRLTARTGTGAQNFPVAVRLLTIADLIKIFGGAFIAGAERSDLEPSMAMIDRTVSEARRRLLAEPQAGLSEEDVWDIRHYFTTHFGEEPLVRALLTGGYWEMLTGLVSHLPNADRGRLLSVLWGGLAPVTETFVMLADAVASLGCGREARCALDAVLGIDSRTGRFQRRPDNVLSAQTLQGLGRPDDNTVVVSSQFGQWVSIQRTVLAAIIAEVRLPVANPSCALLEKADLLEFPSIDAPQGGANLVRGLRKDPGQLGALYMRAKSTYLLERYVEEQALTSMAVCLEAGNARAGELEGLVSAWVEKSHGADAPAREQQANGLFLCLTKFDKDFAEPSRRTKERRVDWGQRLQTTLVEGFGRHQTWPTAWTTSRAFDNVHLLRNPTTRAKHLLNYGSDNRELGYKPEQKDRLERMRRDFTTNDIVRRHVDDPAAIWSEALELNDGGITYLAQSMEAVCDERAKHRHVLNDLGLLGKSLRDRLQRYYVSSDLELQQDRRRIAGLMVTRRLRRCAEERRLGHLIRALQLTDTEFNDVLLRHEAAHPTAPRHTNGEPAKHCEADGPMHEALAGADRAPANGTNGHHVNVHAVNGHAVNGHALDGHPLNGHGPAMNGHAAHGIGDPNPTAEIARDYAGVVVTHWVASARLFAQADRICQTLQMPRSSLLQLVDELIAGTHRLELEARIAHEIQGIMADAPDASHRIARAAMCAANVIGDYVMWLGCNDTLSNNHPRRKGRGETPIFPPKVTSDIWAVAADDGDLDREFLSDWSQAFLRLVDDNATDIAGRDIDTKRNQKLGELLAELNIQL